MFRLFLMGEAMDGAPRPEVGLLGGSSSARWSGSFRLA
jgi:hypothetical protein